MNAHALHARVTGWGLALVVLLLTMAVAGAGGGPVTTAVAQTPYVPFYRVANYHTGDHFYTTDWPEARNAIQTLGYTYEGITGYISSSAGPGLVPLLRLVNGQNGDHFYTTDSTEALNAGPNYGYTYEGIAGYVWKSPTPNLDLVKLYRLVSDQHGHHFYTTSYAEAMNAMTYLGYSYEGEAAWIIAMPWEFTLATPQSAYAVGETVRFEVVLHNRGATPITLHFDSGQSFKIFVSTLAGTVVWESRGPYTFARRTETVAPGKELRWSDVWDQRSTQAAEAGTRTLVDPGYYQAVARLTTTETGPLSNPVGFRLR
jgi:hypothetical protein